MTTGNSQTNGAVTESWFKSAWGNAVYWKVAIFKGVNGFLLVILLAFLGGTDSVDWEKLMPFEKIRLALVCIAAGCKFLDGFLDQTVQNLRVGKNGNGNGVH